MIFQFTALGGINFHHDLYSFQKETEAFQLLTSLPVPSYRVISESNPEQELSSHKMPLQQPKKDSWPVPGMAGITGQGWAPQGVRQSSGQTLLTSAPQKEVKQIVPQTLKPQERTAPAPQPQETKKEADKKWSPLGYYSSAQGTDSLIDDAIKRLKKGN
jgi:hypothetical protein